MRLACLDLEGVLVPEIWIRVSEAMEIPDLARTTRDEPDYDRLMRFRLDVLHRQGIHLPAIQEVIAAMGPLEGARAFLDRLRERMQVVILSDTFYQFSAPLMRQLGFPSLFCNALDVNDAGVITGYRLRQPDGKRRAVEAFRSLRFETVAAGDSYNDTTMLSSADAGILFCPPENVEREFPQFPVARSYTELEAAFALAESQLEARSSP